MKRARQVFVCLFVLLVCLFLNNQTGEILNHLSVSRFLAHLQLVIHWFALGLVYVDVVGNFAICTSKMAVLLTASLREGHRGFILGSSGCASELCKSTAGQYKECCV